MTIEVGRCLWPYLDALNETLPELCARSHESQPLLEKAGWLRPYEYRVLSGPLAVRGRVYPNRLQAVGERDEVRGLSGRQAVDFASGGAACWILRGQRGDAVRSRLSVQEPLEVLRDILEAAMRRHAGARDALVEARRKLSELSLEHPTLVRRARRRLGGSKILEVLRDLSLEGAMPHDLAWAVDRLAATPHTGASAQRCAERLREEMKQTFSNSLVVNGRIRCLHLEPSFQQWLYCRCVRHREVDLADRELIDLLGALVESVGPSRAGGKPAALLCVPSLRPALSALLRPFYRKLRVLKPSEVDPRTRLKIERLLPRPGRKSRWLTSLRFWSLPRQERAVLRDELELYERTFRDGPREEPAESSPPALPIQPRRLVFPALTARQKAAVFLLECPTWMLREILSRLDAEQIAALGREMTRLGRHCPGLRDEVLREFPSLVEPVNLAAVVQFVQRLLDLPHPYHALTDAALCLCALGSVPCQRVLPRIFDGLDLDQTERLRAELVRLRKRRDPEAFAQAVDRFTRFYRGSVLETPVPGKLWARWAIQAAVLRNPLAMASSLERLCPRGQPVLVEFQRWAHDAPHRAACWLLRWIRNWSPPAESSLEPVRAAYASLPGELASMLDHHLGEDFRAGLKGGVELGTEPVIYQRWLQEYFLNAYRTRQLPPPTSN
ncbi:MAG: FHIPEP family type III secretion protein [Armatimonadetes bacterium]|nr:FHIPEP family type III secretion protein [Armatimonadota bacterium]